MLLRSASTPLVNSLVHASSPRESPIEPESVHQIQRPTRSLMLSSSCCYSPMSVHSSDESARRMKRTASESDLRHLTSTKPPASKFLSGGGGALMEEDVEEGIGFGIIRTSSYDGFSWGLDDTEVSGGCGGGGGVIHGGGNGDAEDGDDGTDVHYRKMIEANPGNGIFLSNYAKFLKEVRKHYLRAEEYCGRAILTNPNDGNVLAMYAELVWTIHKDSSRAESYFVRAVAAAPDDCYVQASYARFLWDADEEEEEEEETHEEEELEPQTSRMSFYTGPSPITAMS